ncbi:MAG TPA: hypothetical protein VGS19_03195 [Streptosporangiaceae bacterium]|nr:hypothetical protein [Streptosporangiaceae bacterium]
MARMWKRRRSGSRPNAGALAERTAEFASEVSEAPYEQDRRRLAKSLRVAARSRAQAAGRGTRAAGRGVGLGSGWLVSQAQAMVLRLRVRDRATLQEQFPGMWTEDLADLLIERAGRASAAVGGTVGAWATLPVLPAFPAEIAAETLALVGIEVKLIAELHEVYGMPAPGSAVDRMTAYLGAWAQRRAVILAPGGLVVAAGSPLARLLRRRLAARAGRSVFSLGPLLTGSLAGAVLNRRETHRLGQDVRADLRRRAAARDQGIP